MTLSAPVRILLIDKSPIDTKILKNLIQTDSLLKVVGCLASGEEALYFIQNAKPDVIVIDNDLPRMDAFEITRQIMQSIPIPIIIVSRTFHKKNVDESFKAIQVGALEIIEKPYHSHDPTFSTLADALIQSIKNAAILKLTTRQSFHKHAIESKQKKEALDALTSTTIQAIAIGASLGGPTALNTIFSQLPATFPLPIFVVQHIGAGFNKDFVRWIQSSSFLKIKLAEEGEAVQRGCVYIAPEHFHLEITASHHIYLSKAPPENGLRPSVGHLFRSMANAYGKYGMGIILTGMGHDGAADLLLMRQKGAFTIAQDRESSFIFGMPKEAISLGAAQFILSLQQIISVLNSLVK